MAELGEQILQEKSKESDFGMLKGSLIAFFVSYSLSFLILMIEMKISCLLVHDNW